MIHVQRSGLNIVVLAAGFSTRLGQPKALARIHGIALLHRTVSILSAVTPAAIRVVAPPRAAGLRAALRGCRVVWLANVSRAGGLSTSVATALRNAPFSAATLLVPADLPHLTRGDVLKLVNTWRGHRRQVVARAVAGRAGAPLILPRYLYSRASRIVGDVGLRDFIATLPAADRRTIELPSAAFDVDTPQQLAHARRRFTMTRPAGTR